MRSRRSSCTRVASQPSRSAVLLHAPAASMASATPSSSDAVPAPAARRSARAAICSSRLSCADVMAAMDAATRRCGPAALERAGREPCSNDGWWHAPPLAFVFARSRAAAAAFSASGKRWPIGTNNRISTHASSSRSIVSCRTKRGRVRPGSACGRRRRRRRWRATAPSSAPCTSSSSSSVCCRLLHPPRPRTGPPPRPCPAARPG